MSASIADVLTAIKNIVTAINAQTQATLSIAGSVTLAGISAPTSVSIKAGRLAQVSVTTAGTGPGTVYDSATNGTTKPVYVIPAGIADQPYIASMPISFGIYVVPGTGQTVAVSYS